MENAFNEDEAAELVASLPSLPQDLAMRIYTSRLLGVQPALVLHGGGNTSVKLSNTNIFGDIEEILYVKGSGADLGGITAPGFVGLSLSCIKRLRSLEKLSDDAMENQLKINKIDHNSPDPSVEALLHAFLPYKYVDHTHADSILQLTNQPDGQDIVHQVLGSKVAFLPYIVSGLPLAKAVIECYENHQDAQAIIIAYHGIFTFGDTAKIAYDRMIAYVTLAESYIKSKTLEQACNLEPDHRHKPNIAEQQVARCMQIVRGACSYIDDQSKRRRFLMEMRCSPDVIAASLSKNAEQYCQTGVITPDHAIWTKNKFAYVNAVPAQDSDLEKLVNETIAAYKIDYEKYFQDNIKAKNVHKKALDAFPRVFLIAGIGVLALGVDRRAAGIAADIAEHTLTVKRGAENIGTYHAISEAHVFDMEYWSLQQKKLDKQIALQLQGQVALVTGAGGAIGFGIAERLLAAGAVVVLADIDYTTLRNTHAILAQRYRHDRIITMVFDVTDFAAVEAAFAKISRWLGGIDIVVPNAGIAHVAKLEDLEPSRFEAVVAVNLMGVFNLIKAVTPMFRRQGTGGHIVLISSKNVPDPGAAFGAYSASKAAAHQIAKIAALELAELGVSVNMVNPDAVFGDDEVPSKLWDLIGPDRMKARGLDPAGLKDYYRQRNLLKIAVKPEHVGNVVVFFASDLSPTTGATLPVDGGVPAAFPR